MKTNGRENRARWILTVGFLILGGLNLAFNPDLVSKAYATAPGCDCGDCSWLTCGDGSTATCVTNCDGDCQCMCQTCPSCQGP